MKTKASNDKKPRKGMFKSFVKTPACTACAAVILYIAVMYLSLLGTDAAMNAFIEENGLTGKTLAYFPAAVKTIIACWTDIRYIPACAVCIALTAVFGRRAFRRSKRPAAAIAASYAGGIALSGLCFLLPLACGCVRTMSVSAPTMLYEAISFASLTIKCVSADMLVLGAVYGCMRRLSPPVRIACGAMIYLPFAFDATALGFLPVLCAALLALLMVLLCERFGLAAACAFRAAWTYAMARIWALGYGEHAYGLFFETYKTDMFYLSGKDGLITCAVIAVCTTLLIYRRMKAHEDRSDLPR